MPTQFSRLLHSPAPGLPDPLLRLLQQHEPAAVRELARRYNRKQTNRTRHLTLPSEGDTYDTCDLTLLALVWALVQDEDALNTLTHRLCLPVPTEPQHEAMSDELLGQLWDRGRDGDALEELWRRQGFLPVERIDDRTTEKLLGFLCWHDDRADAWEELLRRYGVLDIQRCSDDADGYARAEARLLERFRFGRVPVPFQSGREFASVVADKIVHLVRLWDYVRYPTLENLLVKAIRNFRRDATRHPGRNASGLGDAETDDLPDRRRTAPSAAAELQDDLEVRLPWEERVVRKAQNGFPLTDEELTWTARRNLEVNGNPRPTPGDVTRERAVVAAWLAANPGPSGADLAGRFPWYKPTQFGKTSRVTRLRLLLAEVEKDLLSLLDDGDDAAYEAAGGLLRAMQDLVKRAGSGNRPGREPLRGPVSCFRVLADAGDRLFDNLRSRPLSRRAADTLDRCRANLALFADHFPILVKLAACHRLAGHLLRNRAGDLALPLAQLTGWLDAGQQWLSSFPEEDKKCAGAFAEALEPLTQQFTGSEQAEVRLLRLWLATTQEPGAAMPRLLALDRVWHRHRERGAEGEVGELVEQAHAGRWQRTAETAGRLLADWRSPATAEPAWQDLIGALKQLRGRRTRPIRHEACKRLCTYLRNAGTAEIARWEERLRLLDAADEDEQNRLWVEVDGYRASQDMQASPGNGAALELLGLWLKPAGMSLFTERALTDLDRLWWLTHDEWYSWPTETAPRVEQLIEIAAEGDGVRLAEEAVLLLRSPPDVSRVARLVGEEFRECLQRLTRRRGQKGRPPRG